MVSYIQTYSGVKFYPQNPTPDTILIEDIAHALAQTCRYGGHTDMFYSVAEHCVLLTELIIDNGLRYESYGVTLLKHMLLHDGSEAYLGDVPSPIKRMLPDYIELEKTVQSAIINKFIGDDPLMEDTQKIVDEFDRSILGDEMHLMMKPSDFVSGLRKTGLFKIEYLRPRQAKERFLDLFNKIEAM